MSLQYIQKQFISITNRQGIKSNQDGTQLISNFQHLKQREDSNISDNRLRLQESKLKIHSKRLSGALPPVLLPDRLNSQFKSVSQEGVKRSSSISQDRILKNVNVDKNYLNISTSKPIERSYHLNQKIFRFSSQTCLDESKDIPYLIKEQIIERRQRKRQNDQHFHGYLNDMYQELSSPSIYGGNNSTSRILEQINSSSSHKNVSEAALRLIRNSKLNGSMIEVGGQKKSSRDQTQTLNFHKEIGYLSNCYKNRSKTQESLLNSHNDSNPSKELANSSNRIKSPMRDRVISPVKERQFNSNLLQQFNQSKTENKLPSIQKEQIPSNQKKSVSIFIEPNQKQSGTSQNQLVGEGAEEMVALSHSWNVEVRKQVGKEFEAALNWAIQGSKSLTEVAELFKPIKLPKNGKEEGVEEQEEEEQDDEQAIKQKQEKAFAEYLSRFACYVADLTFGEVPKTSNWRKSYRFKVSLQEPIMDTITSCIINKAKELGFHDVMPLFKVIFREEFIRVLSMPPLTQDSFSQEALRQISDEFLCKLLGKYDFNVQEYLPTCQRFLNDLIGKQDLQQHVVFLQTKIYSVLHPPLEGNNGQAPQEIVKAEYLLNAKKALYDAFKSSGLLTSSASKARVLQTIELMRFQYFKDSYSIEVNLKDSLIKVLLKCVKQSPPLCGYFRTQYARSEMVHFFTYLVESILGEQPLSTFLEKSFQILGFEVDLFFLSMMEQIVKGFLEQTRLSRILQRELEHKFIHLKRRAKVTPSFSSAFYQMDDIVSDLAIWMEQMYKHNQHSENFHISNQECAKKMGFLEYFLTCALSDYDTFSLFDFQLGLSLNSIQKPEFIFWVKGIRRVLLKLKLRQQEANFICEYILKAFTHASNT